ncbi:DUF3500 domain-containing protein [Chitinophaga silvatica]|uniref:DUF3500 domain-containing protein n=1 Tax=Chitinophaga silvatica TaxID=2282649 RepID=A0A3E1Y661_9BACT|nr:DUF3500 domain-containing protein [Chitinophaga silvatica]RFS20192.1 DUF3500 domain-containing protein [Chitinophaga silvatica]
MRFLLLSACLLITLQGAAQDMANKANQFIKLLSKAQQEKAIYPFDTAERERFAYVPLDNRKGISVNELSKEQREKLIVLLSTALSNNTVNRVQDIMQLDNVLKELENRKADDHYRDPGKYFITIFGTPEKGKVWGWRFEGHHVAFNFSSENNKLVAGTPSFLGANPAVVQSGPQKGKEVLKAETAQGFALLEALNADELQKALVNTAAPAEIITGASRKVQLIQPMGIRYNELSKAAQAQLYSLISLYVNRYTKLFANSMLKEIEEAGMENLYFAWAGDTGHTPGKPYYYRIQGPTLIIEYDNTQNNANHVHTVIRDLKRDFGGDELLEHYRAAH